MAPVRFDFADPAINYRYLAGGQIGLYVGGDVMTVAKDSQSVCPVMEEPDLIVRLRARPDEAPVLVGDFKAVAVGAWYDGGPPAISKARNIRHLISDAITQNQAARPQAFVIVRDNAKIVEGARYALGPRVDQLDRWITCQLLPCLDQDVLRWLVIVAEHAVRTASKAIALPTSIEDRDLATGTAKLQGCGKTGKAASDDDDVIHGDEFRIEDVRR